VAPTAGTRKDADIAAFRAARDSGAVGMLLDVRTPAEFAEGHVPGAVNVPVDALASRMGELAGARGKDLYVICAVGGRSAIAADRLAAAGFSATNVLGGTNAWVAAGGAVER
jgi:rhodanese-related sulfurtransferase